MARGYNKRKLPATLLLDIRQSMVFGKASRSAGIRNLLGRLTVG